MNGYLTVVIAMPSAPDARARVQDALRLLEPYRTAMSLEDEITVLDMIEQHEDFEDYIAEDARERARLILATNGG